MKHQVLFSLKNDEKIFMNVVCCIRDWRFKGKYTKSDDMIGIIYLLFVLGMATINIYRPQQGTYFAR